jgi:hypothetical protein
VVFLQKKMILDLTGDKDVVVYVAKRTLPCQEKRRRDDDELEELEDLSELCFNPLSASSSAAVILVDFKEAVEAFKKIEKQYIDNTTTIYDRFDEDMIETNERLKRNKSCDNYDFCDILEKADRTLPWLPLPEDGFSEIPIEI